MNNLDKHFDNFAQEYWFSFISSSIPQDLNNLYKDDIGKINSGFSAGIDATLLFYKDQIKSADKTKNDR